MRSGDPYVAALGELYGIADQIEEYLAQAAGIAIEQAREIPIKPGFEFETSSVRCRAKQRHGGIDRLLRVEIDSLQCHPSRIEFGEIENIVDDRQQRVGRPFCSLDVAVLLLVQRGFE